MSPKDFSAEAGKKFLSRTVATAALLLAGALAVSVPAARAQSTPPASSAAAATSTDDGAPHKGDREMQVRADGGFAVAGPVPRNERSMDVTFRYGWVLTASHGPGPLRGNLEYSLGATPLFLLFEPSGTAYGVSISPISLKWNFDSRHSFKPYFDSTFGPIFTDQKIPTGVSQVNFDTSFAYGFIVPRGNYHWNIELRYMHISDAHLTAHNPGINVLEAGIGIALFTHRK